jgi:aminobenzoyl-glutamate transport protein
MTPAPRRSAISIFLDTLERVGNRLPNPATMFLLLAGLVAVLSYFAALLGLSVTHPKDGSAIAAVNLISAEGVRRMFTEAVRNFVNFAPLGTVLVAMIGIGVAEASGLVSAAMRGFVMGMPRGLLTAAIVFAGVNANQAADAGIVILPPLGAMLFAAAGRHPLAGLAAAFAGVAGGFSANLLPSTLDVLLAGFTQEAVNASKLLPGYGVQIIGNYYFMVVATPILTVLGTWVTHRFLEPRLGEWKGEAAKLEPLGAEERRGLRAAGVATLLTVVGLALFTLVPGAPLRAEAPAALERLKPFFDSMVTIVMLVFFVPGLVYGIATRRIRTDHDVMKMTSDTMATMGSYIVLAFTCAQFVNYFSWSNLGPMLAISGAGALRALGLEGAPLVGGFVIFAALLNLLITSASAKWAIVAPVFVPMFVLLGISPEGTQVVFRVGDSCTNIITPLMPYMPFVLACAQRYQPGAGPGTITSLMLPYSAVFLVSWTALLMLFYAAGWPIGPGVKMRMADAAATASAVTSGAALAATPAAPAKPPASSSVPAARPPKKEGSMAPQRIETATLAGGCFWCVEAVLEPLEGVHKVVSGYSGGHAPKPTYNQVCTGTTGHAEVVQVTFDPSVISYRELLEIFFAFHDPTTLNRQGADVGTQYRSAIYYSSPEQKATAEQVIAELTKSKVFDDPIVTEVAPLTGFFPAEDYHQEYYRNNSNQPYCQAVISPKISKLRAKYSARLKGAAKAGTP